MMANVRRRARRFSDGGGLGHAEHQGTGRGRKRSTRPLARRRRVLDATKWLGPVFRLRPLPTASGVPPWSPLSLGRVGGRSRVASRCTRPAHLAATGRLPLPRQGQICLLCSWQTSNRTWRRSWPTPKCPGVLDVLSGAITEPAWRTKPSWYLVATEDRMIPPDAQRLMSKRANATVVETAASHAVYVSQPETVATLIETAVKGIG